MLLNYSLKRSIKALHLRISIKEDGNIYVSAPIWLSVSKIEDFLKRKEEWISRKIKSIKNQGERIYLPKGKKDYLQNKEKARIIITQKANKFSQILNLKFSKIRIGNQKSRWGSCAKNGTLSLNYKLLYLPENLTDYIVVHEICHLKEFNHSHRFWTLVSSIFPNWKELCKELKKYKLS